MMWIPLRASKMNGFILGFHRLVWWPKWTPESSNSLTPMLITSFLWLRIRRAQGRIELPEPSPMATVIFGHHVLCVFCVLCVSWLKTTTNPSNDNHESARTTAGHLRNLYSGWWLECPDGPR